MDHKKNTTDLISERIKERIISGDYSPSQHLVEIKLAKELGVSRHIIRIALDRLQSEGLVRIEPNRGAVVTSLTLGEVIDIITARELLESAVAGMAAKQIKPTHIRGLEECLGGHGEQLRRIFGPVRIQYRRTPGIGRAPLAEGAA